MVHVHGILFTRNETIFEELRNTCLGKPMKNRLVEVQKNVIWPRKNEMTDMAILDFDDGTGFYRRAYYSVTT